MPKSMSIARCVHSLHTIVTSLWRFLSWQSDPKSYFSKTSNALIGIWDQTSPPGSKHDLISYRRSAEDTSHSGGVQHGIVHLFILYVSYTVAITLVCVSLRHLTRYMPRVMANKHKAANNSKLIDEEEVELYSIDSIEEFEKMSKTETEASEALPDSAQERSRYEPNREDDQDFSYDTDLSFSSDPNNNHSPHYDKNKGQQDPQQVNIFSVMATPLNSIKTMLSQASPDFSLDDSNSTETADDVKVDVVPKTNYLRAESHGKAGTKQTERITKRRAQNRELGPFRESNLVSKPTKSTPSRRPVSTMVKHRSMNTEIRTYKMADKSTTESASGHETDMETEMVMIDLPANYYYQNRLRDKQEPYLVNLKPRVKVK